MISSFNSTHDFEPNNPQHFSPIFPHVQWNRWMKNLWSFQSRVVIQGDQDCTFWSNQDSNQWSTTNQININQCESPSWSNRDPFVMVCCHNPHITGLFFIPKKSRNSLGRTVWGPFFLHCCCQAPRFRRAHVLLRRRSASRCPTTSMSQCGCHPFCWTTSPAIHAIFPPKSPPPVVFWFKFC